MPLTPKGEEIKSNMEKKYGPKKGEQVFYASANKGTIKGVHDIEDPKPSSGPMSTSGPSARNVEGLPEAATPSSKPSQDCGSAMSLDEIKVQGKRIGRY